MIEILFASLFGGIVMILWNIFPGIHHFIIGVISIIVYILCLIQRDN